MLTLSRRPGEEVLVFVPGGPPLIIRHGGRRGGATRLHFEGRPDVVIDRAELHERIALNEDAAED